MRTDAAAGAGPTAAAQSVAPIAVIAVIAAVVATVAAIFALDAGSVTTAFALRLHALAAVVGTAQVTRAFALDLLEGALILAIIGAGAALRGSDGRHRSGGDEQSGEG